jgi:diadenylate cyclase
MVDVKLEQKMESRLVQALHMLAPGTPLREGIDNIIRAKTGSLIILGDEKQIAFLFSGGLRLDRDFSPNVVYELAKMDGATILNKNGTRILRANVQLMPDSAIDSSETGTRHRTAERVAKQTDALAISISQDRDLVSLYVDNIKYVLSDMRVLLAKADQALQTLEKYRARLDQVADNLNALEFEDAVTLHDVIGVLQRIEMVARVAREIERYLIELGTEGRLISMQLEELMTGVAKDREALIRDYSPARGPRLEKIEGQVCMLSADELFESDIISKILGYKKKTKSTEVRLSPRGFRILSKVPRLPAPVIENIVNRFGNLKAVTMASEDDLVEVEGVGRIRAREIVESLVQFRELSLSEKYSFR